MTRRLVWIAVPLALACGPDPTEPPPGPDTRTEAPPATPAAEPPAATPRPSEPPPRVGCTQVFEAAEEDLARVLDQLDYPYDATVVRRIARGPCDEPRVSRCLVGLEPGLAAYRRCVGRLLLHDLDRAHHPDARPTEASLLRSLRGRWRERDTGATLMVRGDTFVWNRAEGDSLQGTLRRVRAGQVRVQPDALVLLPVRIYVAVASRRTLVISHAASRTQLPTGPVGDVPRLFDIDDAGNAFAQTAAGCRWITPAGDILPATCRFEPDSVHVESGSRAATLRRVGEAMVPPDSITAVFER